MREGSESTRAILRNVYAHGAIPRGTLARLTNLTESAVSRITRRLIDGGVLSEGAKIKSPNQVGRRHTELRFGDGAYNAGIGIRVFKQWVQLADFSGRVIASETFVVADLSDADGVVAECCERLAGLIARVGADPDRLLGIGVAIVGVVDSRAGNVVRADNLGWGAVTVGASVRQRFGVPVFVDSYLNALNLTLNGLPDPQESERTVLLVLIAWGIGSSLIVGRQIVSGTGYAAGQIGHIKVPGADEPCSCGRRGCLDTVASGKAILARLHDPALVECAPAQVYAQAATHFEAIAERAETEPRTAAALDEAGRALGRALAAIAAAIDPDEIQFSGFVARAPAYFAGVEAGLGEHRDLRGDAGPALTLHESSDLAPASLALHHFVFCGQDDADQRLAAIVDG